MFAKRYLITLGLLIVSLFALVTGVNAALDRVGKSATQNSVVIYDEQGQTLFAYNGNLNYCPISIRPPLSFAGPRFLHRT